MQRFCVQRLYDPDCHCNILSLTAWPVSCLRVSEHEMTLLSPVTAVYRSRSLTLACPRWVLHHYIASSAVETILRHIGNVERVKDSAQTV
jgi:hypothetical protein